MIYAGIGKYQALTDMTNTQQLVWNLLPVKTRVAIRNGVARGMTTKQLHKHKEL